MQKPVAAPVAGNLLATKFFVPPLREGPIPRPRLVERLEPGPARRLTLVSAPAGFGKSSILAEWVQHVAARGEAGPGIAWLYLDAGDNDPVRFLSCVIVALQRAVPGVASDLVAALRSPQPPAAEAVITALVNELAPIPRSFVLVLDDYHAITSTAVNGAVTFLLDSLPPNLHVVISTRADPPIPIARLRSRGQVVEIRTDDLRLTPDEAAAFLNQTMGLALSPEQAAALDERAEGWIAGLQMAALSMRGREDVDGFIRAFAGTHRFIMDYLLEEVLAREPQDVQAFLLETAILAGLSGPLCDAVTGRSGGREMLEGLERRNLFVVPLDDERRWYRYHHLFADLLQARLQQTRPQLVSALHSRAAAWYEAHGLAHEAVGHAFAGGDVALAARLVEESHPRLLARGELATGQGWVRRLPEEALSSRPLLCVYSAMGAAWAGRTDEAEHLLRAAERCLPPAANSAQARALVGMIAYTRSRLAGMRGELARAVELANLARESVPANDAVMQPSIAVMLGYAHFLRGNLHEASEALGECVTLARAGSGVNAGVAALCVLARVRCVQGRLRQAADIYRQALEMIEEQGERRLGVASVVDAGMGELLYEWNELPQARERLQQCLAGMQWWGKPDDLALTQVTVARVLQAQGDLRAAGDALSRAWQVVRAHRVFAEARGAVEVAQVRLWLAQGNLSEAGSWAPGSQRVDDGPSLVRELQEIARARVLIAQARPGEAATVLGELAEAAEGGGRYGRLVEIKALEAVALHAQGEAPRALVALDRALRLAEPEGYVRVFVDEGEPMAALLRKLAARPARASESGGCSARYLARLLGAFGAPGGALLAAAAGRADRAAHGGGMAALIEPLSERELEVLRLMAEGLTNKEIAATLIIALGTVKAHVHNISGKLGAQNRVHAIVRARELGLL
ncbi:MAG: LuxR C-terminal-related transcriptional regulator [Anaerolineae bacterium]|nr:LuxR C-terminal-related transcriptional regulator [Anaerolineae bacterium]